MEKTNSSGYSVSDDRARLDVDRVANWLANESYWATGRPPDTVRSSISGSLCIGLYAPDGAQVGFCRWVTDYATFAWLCDVYVEHEHTGSGLGTWLVESAVTHRSIQGCKRRVLATADAHELYSKFGFESFDAATAGHWMMATDTIPSSEPPIPQENLQESQ